MTIRHTTFHRTSISLMATLLFACGLACGTLIAHWDDDDWHHPRRLSIQVEALARSHAQLCGSDSLRFYDSQNAAAWLYRSANTQWLCGGTLMYHRVVVRTCAFREQSNGEDTAFVADALAAGFRATTIPSDLYIALMHSGNTVPQRPGLQWQRIDPVPLRGLFEVIP